LADFYIGQGDTASPLIDVLRDADGNPVNIQGATVALKIVPLRGGPAIVDDPADVDQNGDGSDGSKGKVSREWTAGETAEAGSYLGQWIVTFAGGDVQTFPNTGYLLIEITGDPALTGGRYLTLEELKKTLKLDGRSFADRDIEVAIAAAADALDEHYGGPWTLGPPGVVHYFTPVAKETLIELRPPLVAVTAVDLDTAGAGAFDSALVEGTDFELERDGEAPASGPWNGLRMLRTGLAWDWRYPSWRSPYPWGVDSLRITGTWGWSEVPAGVKVASSIIATRFLRRAREGPFGFVGIGPEGASMRAGAIALDPEVAFAMRGGAGKGPGAKRVVIV
jgi:hypothetical protein